MKKLFSLSLLLAAAFCVCASEASAQGKMLSYFKYLAKSDPRYARILMTQEQKAMEEAVRAQAAGLSAETSAKAAATAAVPVSPSLVSKHQRTLAQLQIKLGVPPRTALQNVRKWGAEEYKKPKQPALTSQPFFAQDFRAFVYEGKEIPRLPFWKNEKWMFRGLRLSPGKEDMHNILKNGLRTKDVGADRSNLLISYAANNGPQSVAMVSQWKITWFTWSPLKALEYATKGGIRKSQISVIVAVHTRQVPYQVTAYLTHDLPAEEIDEVIALLSVNGTPAWCRVEPADTGFKITPYTPGEK